jgi:predicted dithiol-disulfide oxidoreductase (DUF899 family)
MERMTITEALSEIKLIKAKTDKLRQLVKANLYRFEEQPDIFEKEGGSKRFAEATTQAVKDHEDRLTKIRAAITKANLENTITLGSDTKSIFEWITWKREVSQARFTFINGIQQELKNVEDKFRREPPAYRDKEQVLVFYKVQYNLDYSTFVTKAQEVADQLQKLDGQLSLKNATLVIEF